MTHQTLHKKLNTNIGDEHSCSGMVSNIRYKARKSYIKWSDENVRFVLYQHA